LEQLSLQLSIGFFCVMAGAWAALCLYLRAAHRARAETNTIETAAAAPARMNDDDMGAAQAA